MEQQLQDYIKQSRTAGLSDEEIKKNLLNVGWDKEMVDEGLNSTENDNLVRDNGSGQLSIKLLFGKRDWKIFNIGVILMFVIILVIMIGYPYFVNIHYIYSSGEVDEGFAGALRTIFTFAVMPLLFFNIITAVISVKKRSIFFWIKIIYFLELLIIFLAVFSEIRLWLLDSCDYSIFNPRDSSRDCIGICPQVVIEFCYHQTFETVIFAFFAVISWFLPLFIAKYIFRKKFIWFLLTIIIASVITGISVAFNEVFSDFIFGIFPFGIFP